MIDSANLEPKSGSLNGARIWLSGSVPEPASSTSEEREAIVEFVSRFSDIVFRLGGHILHGSHPSITPTLLRQAAKHQENGGRKDCLTLCVSRYFSKDLRQVPLNEWERICTVYETPESSGPDARDKSLQILRKWMSARCDVVVVLGGKWWEQIDGRSGVPIELELAIERGVPCFLLGGLGGVAREYLLRHAHVLSNLRNGLDDAHNSAIATETDVPSLAKTVCDQLLRLPLVKGRGSDGVSFRILSLDGGGIKGTFASSVLATWEEHTQLRIVDHFDLVAGTSTGGVLAIGLGMGLSAHQMLEFYRKRGPVIFPLTSMAQRAKYLLRHVVQPKFSQEVLLRELQNAYFGSGGARSLKASKCRLLIPAYHAVAGASHVFRTPHHPLLTSDGETDVAHVALATAAAPTFFSAAVVGNMIAESSYFDGGVWANSPALAAIVEAVCFLGIPLDRVDVLSVGTTDEPFTVRGQARAGIVRWARHIVRLLMSAQEEAGIKQARLLAGEPRFLRVNVMTVPGSYKLDSPKEIEELAALGNREALKPEILGQVRSRFLNGVLASPWQHFGP